jgi:hypothetical protein
LGLDDSETLLGHKEDISRRILNIAMDRTWLNCVMAIEIARMIQLYSWIEDRK